MSKTPLCAVCRRAPPSEAYRPFCSRRCADVDLQRWFGGRYALASDDQEGVEPPSDFDRD
jgi:hypothetical protein